MSGAKLWSAVRKEAVLAEQNSAQIWNFWNSYRAYNPMLNMFVAMVNTMKLQTY